MAQTLIIYIGRDNVEAFDLLIDDVLVTVDTITKAHFKFGDYCIDTVNDAAKIALTESKTRVEITAGHISGLAVGVYEGKLTCYDAEATNGIAWEDFNVQVETWPVCEA
jgi:hypothetical protein